MDVLNRVGAALVARLQTMSRGARLLLGLMMLVAVLSVAMLGSSPADGPDMYLLGGEAVPSDQLPRLEAAFARAGLSDYQMDAGRVRIPSQRHAAYMTALAAADALPPNFSEILDKPLREASPLMSRAQQEESIKIARQQALASIIQSMKGVQRAQVLYDREKNPGLGRGQNITASVTVTMQRGEQLQPQQVVALRKLLAGAIAGLEPEKVAVIDLGSGRSFPLDPAVATENALTQAMPAAAIEPNLGRKHDPGTSPPRPPAAARTPNEPGESGDAARLPQPAALAWGWASQHARPLGLGGLALAGVVIISALTCKRSPHVLAVAEPAERSVVAERPTLETTPAEVAHELAASALSKREEPQIELAESGGAAAQPVPVSPPARRGEPKPPADLGALVRNDPSTAAKVLRQWIGSQN